MLDTTWMPPPEKNYRAAKREYLERHGSLAVMNTYLKVAVLALSIVCIGLVIVDIRVLNMLRNAKPVIIRITDVGRAEAIKAADVEYHPQEPEIKFFLIDFVERYYSRIRATLRDNYARSLYFLDGRVADALIEENKKTHALENFLAGSGDECDVHVTGVSIEDLRKPPYRATVDFEKLYYAPNRVVSRREKYVANFVFAVKDHVPNELIPVNPLGLTITYFRQDQTFQ